MKDTELDSLVISANPDSELIISISGGETISISPSRIKFTSLITTATFNITAMVAGYYSIRYQLSGRNAGKFVVPEDTAVIVEASVPSRMRNQYVETLGLNFPGLVFDSCCVPPNFAFQCSSSNVSNRVEFRSACSWTATENSRTTAGVVFAENQGFRLPISIAGVEIDSSYRARLPQSSLIGCTPCRDVRPNCCPSDKPNCNRQMNRNNVPTCYCYNFTIADTLDFLKTLTLAFTYISNIRDLLPSWFQLIQISPIASNFDEGGFSQYEYTTELVSAENIPQLSNCEMIKPDALGLYAVMRYGRAIIVRIDRQQLIYRDSNIQPDHENPMCFAVNLCNGSESPVFIQLSPRIHNIILTNFLKEYVISREWNIAIHSVALYKKAMSLNFNTMEVYWNGISIFQLQTVQFDLKMTTNIDATFQSGDLHVDLTFSGTAYYLYEVGPL